jgi:hypothetical protein
VGVLSSGFFVGVGVVGVGVMVMLEVGDGVAVSVGDAVTVGEALGSNVIKGGKTTTLPESPDGVRNVSHQVTGVKIPSEMGGITRAFCLGADSGSSNEFISPLTDQFGDIRMACCPTHIIIATPSGNIKMMMLQSRRCLSWVRFMSCHPFVSQQEAL